MGTTVTQGDVQTCTGRDVLHEVVTLEMANRTDFDIYEVDAGIDIDNASRAYETEREVSYHDLMWSVLNHIAWQGFSHLHSVTDFGGSSGSIAGLPLYIYLGDDDPESLGVTYNIVWRPAL